MCGIYGFFGRAPKNERRKLAELMLKLAVVTLERGRHSTGYYARSDEHEYYEKNAEPANTFYRNSELFVDAIKSSFMFVGHNRAASVGAITTENAHPFIGDNFVGVVNGTFSKIFDIMSDVAFDKIEGETDSEAIIHEFDRHKTVNIPFLKKLKVYSIVLADRNSDKLYFMRDPQRPLVIADMRSTLGCRVFASTGEILETALAKAGYDPDNIDYFWTKSFCLYEGDIETGEVNKLKRYHKAPKPPKPPKQEQRGSTGQPNQNRKNNGDVDYWGNDYYGPVNKQPNADDPDNYHFVKREQTNWRSRLVQRAMATFGD